MLLKGDISNDQRLQDGDVIFIPPIVKSAGIDGEVNNENPCMPMECWDGEWQTIIIDCQEQMGVPCEGGIYIPPAEGDCCSICISLGDISGDGIVNVLDVVAMVNLVLSGGYDVVADMNSDGTLNVLDVVLLVGIILG